MKAMKAIRCVTYVLASITLWALMIALIAWAVRTVL